MFSSPSTVSTVTQASAICGRSSATCSSEGKQTALFWRCWTSGSCWGSEWSTTAAVAAVRGIYSAWRWPTQLTQSQLSFLVETGLMLIKQTGRFRECSTPYIRRRISKGKSEWEFDVVSCAPLYLITLDELSWGKRWNNHNWMWLNF